MKHCFIFKRPAYPVIERACADHTSGKTYTHTGNTRTPSPPHSSGRQPLTQCVLSSASTPTRHPSPPSPYKLPGSSRRSSSALSKETYCRVKRDLLYADFERAFESVPPPPPQATAEAYPGSHSLDSTAPFQATRPLAKRKSQSIRPDDRPLPARDPGCVPIPTLHSTPEILPLNLSPGPKGP